MKKLFVLLFFVLSSTLFADDFAKKFSYETNYKEALKKAKETKKEIVFVLVSDYCPWCDRLKEEVLSLEYTNEILHEFYIPLLQNSTYDKYPSKFESYIVPTIHFISYEDESIIETVVGFNANYRFYEIIEKKSNK